MAESRKREARAKAEALFKTRQQIAQNAADQAWTLERNQSAAALQNDQAEELRVAHIRFAGVQNGVLAVQAVREVDLPLPVLWQPVSWWKRWKELRHDPNHPETGDPQVINAVVEVLGRETLGWPFRRREHENEVRALLRGPVKQIALFVEDPSWPDSFGKKIPSQWDLPYLSCSSSDDWDHVVGNTGSDGAFGDGGVGELLAGGGFKVFRADKGHP